MEGEWTFRHCWQQFDAFIAVFILSGFWQYLFKKHLPFSLAILVSGIYLIEVKKVVFKVLCTMLLATV
jgi:hypothetical protein